MGTTDRTRHWLFRQRQAMAHGWRAAPPSRLSGPMTWTLRHSGLLIVAGGGVLSAIGYMQVGEYADAVGVRPSDLDVPTSTYVAGIGLTLFVFGAFLFVLLAGGRVGVRNAPWFFGLRVADLLGIGAAGLATAVAVGAIGRLASWAAPPEVGLVAWLLYVLGYTFLTGWMLGVMSALVPKSAPKRWLGWTILTVLGAVLVASALDDDVADLAEATQWAAVTDQQEVDSASALALGIRPSKGTVTLVDGTTFCGVRVGDRVFVRPSTSDPDIAETIVQDARSFVSPGAAC